jgi:hypothetical protein
MAGPGVTGFPDGWDPGAVAVLVDYRTRLAAGLAGPRRARLAVLAEIGDGLIEAVDRHLAEGLAAVPAARAAVAEFGDPAWLARLIVAERAGLAAHRVGLGLVLTGPVVGSGWLVAYALGSGSGPAAQIHALVSQFPVLAVTLGVGVPAAVVAAAAGAGPWMRRLTLAPKRAVGLAVLAACAAVAGDATLLTGVAVGSGPAVGRSWPLAVAAGVSLVRLSVAGTAAYRCLRLRAAC